MKRENQFNPCCPRCAKTLMNNGKVKLMKLRKTFYFGKLGFEQITKQRFRCHFCGYSETENSVSHNANVRNGYGYSKRSVAKVSQAQRCESRDINGKTKLVIPNVQGLNSIVLEIKSKA